MEIFCRIYANLWISIVFWIYHQLNHEALQFHKCRTLTLCHYSIDIRCFGGCLLDILPQKNPQLSKNHQGHPYSLCYCYDHYLYHLKHQPSYRLDFYFWEHRRFFSHSINANILWSWVLVVLPHGWGTSYWAIEWWSDDIDIFLVFIDGKCHQIIE